MKVKIRTSYFYQIRFFKENMIPVSTALWDPKWFHKDKKQSYTFIDKRGIINGLRTEMLAPKMESDGECQGAAKCSHTSEECKFLKNYYDQLNELDLMEFLGYCKALATECHKKLNMKDDPVLVFIFHEKPDNPCSERVMFTKWLQENGVPCKELKYPIK